MPKTIKQIADEIGVSKQAVHQKRKSQEMATRLRPFTTIVDGIVYIAVDGERLIKQAFSDVDRKRVDDNEPTTNRQQEDDVLKVLRDTINALQGQLETKDKQMEKKDNQIADMSEQLKAKDKQIEAQQTLHAMTLQQDKPKQLEAKIERKLWQFWKRG